MAERDLVDIADSLAAAKRFACRDCDSTGRTTVHVDMVDRHSRRIGVTRVCDCPTCHGIGYLTPARLERVNDGARLREWRMNRGITLRVFAESHGMSMSRLSQMERGDIPLDAAIRVEIGEAQ